MHRPVEIVKMKRSQFRVAPRRPGRSLRVAIVFVLKFVEVYKFDEPPAEEVLRQRFPHAHYLAEWIVREFSLEGLEYAYDLPCFVFHDVLLAGKVGIGDCCHADPIDRAPNTEPD